MPTRRRPFVLLNMAVSADGKIARADGRFNAFGSPLDQDNLYRLRSTVDAILCGARTAGVPGVMLDAGAERFVKARRRRGLAPQPLRVVVSGSGGLLPTAGVFDGSHPAPIVLTSQAAPPARVKAWRARGAEVAAFGRRDVDLSAALAWLTHEHGVHRLVCEGGGELNDAMFRAHLVDEVHLTLCPVLIGGRRSPTIADGLGVPQLAAATRLRLRRCTRRGDEMFLVFSVLAPRG